MKTILDISSIVYGGHEGNDRRIRGFPCGGLRKAFGIINASLAFGDIAVCFDGGEIIKKELLPTYKEGRVPNYSVLAQIDLLKEMLTDCNIPYYWDAKYEADDFVFSICNELLNLGDTEDIRVYSDDRDMACCVTSNISVLPVTSNGINITRDNFENRVVKGRRIPFNTILLWKVFHGDSSDRYGALRIPGLTFDTFADKAVSEISPLVGPKGFNELAYSRYDLFEELTKFFEDNISAEDMKKLRSQGRIAYPYSVLVTTLTPELFQEEIIRDRKPYYAIEREHMKFFGSGSFNEKRFEVYCGVLGLNRIKSFGRVDLDSSEAQALFTTLELRAKELSSGVMAVERYRHRKEVKEREDTLPNMVLPV